MILYTVERKFPSKTLVTYDAQNTKRDLMQFADNVGLDQPAHLRRLIRAFIAHLQISGYCSIC